MERSIPEKDWLHLLSTDSEKAMDQLFKSYYAYVCKAVFKIIPDTRTAEDIAQEVFMEIWRKRDRFQIATSLKAYLRRAAVNRSLNYIRDNKIVIAATEVALQLQAQGPKAQENLETHELQQLIDQSIDQLPERCRLVFVLSRFEQMTYKEIAEQLGISVKTVENQISKALQLLRAALGPYLGKTLMFLFLWWMT
ncbi:MAG: RNA polymerase sigma-70 factor [Bacteroidota bacterium]